MHPKKVIPEKLIFRGKKPVSWDYLFSEEFFHQGKFTF
jgi:hypothetical protein